MLYKELIRKTLNEYENELEIYNNQVQDIKINYSPNKVMPALTELAEKFNIKRTEYKETISNALQERRKDFAAACKLNSAELDNNAIELVKIAGDENEVQSIAENASYTTKRAINSILNDKPFRIKLTEEEALQKFDTFTRNCLYLFTPDNKNAAAILHHINTDCDSFLKTAE